MTRALIPVSLGLMGLGLTAGVMWWLFAGQREDVATARAFLTLIAESEFSEARALFTPALAVQVSTPTLRQNFGDILPWDRLRFGRRSSQSVGDNRVTELWGSGTTVSGCDSTLYLRIRGGLIDAFRVTPLCPAADSDT